MKVYFSTYCDGNDDTDSRTYDGVGRQCGKQFRIGLHFC